jgi:hypothetical protein
LTSARHAPASSLCTEVALGAAAAAQIASSAWRDPVDSFVCDAMLALHVRAASLRTPALGLRTVPVRFGAALALAELTGGELALLL